jgi:hypothetical protein
LLKRSETRWRGLDIARQWPPPKMQAMVRHELSTGIAQAARVQLRIAAWLLIALGGVEAARAADEAVTKPLDLSLPRQAGQWTGVASRERTEPRPEFAFGAQQQRTLAVQPQPYGTGYEARMSSRASAGALGAAGAGAQGPAVSPAGPRGGHGKGR